MAKFTLEDIIYGDKYGFESTVEWLPKYSRWFQGISAKKEQLNILCVKHTLLVAKKIIMLT